MNRKYSQWQNITFYVISKHSTVVPIFQVQYFFFAVSGVRRTYQGNQSGSSSSRLLEDMFQQTIFSKQPEDSEMSTNPETVFVNFSPPRFLFYAPAPWFAATRDVALFFFVCVGGGVRLHGGWFEDPVHHTPGSVGRPRARPHPECSCLSQNHMALILCFVHCATPNGPPFTLLWCPLLDRIQIIEIQRKFRSHHDPLLLFFCKYFGYLIDPHQWAKFKTNQNIWTQWDDHCGYIYVRYFHFYSMITAYFS